MHVPGFIKSPLLPFYSLYDLPDVIYPVKICFLLYMNVHDNNFCLLWICYVDQFSWVMRIEGLTIIVLQTT